jgi:CheY-like chemotaxis protein
MDVTTYDLEKLAADDVISIDVATRFFYTIQDYFDKLTEYLKNYKSYIGHYNPTVVVVSDAERDVFLADCASVRALLTQLGMNTPLNALNNLENAALAGEIKVLSDGIIVFKGLLEITANHVLSARNEPGVQKIKRRIMLVHDDETVLANLTDMLSDHFTVLSEKSVLTAIEDLKSQLPEIFLIFTEMRDICGYELAYFIRESKPFRHTPLLFLTGTKDRSELHKTLPVMENKYIHLPVKKEELLKKVSDAFNRP